MTKQNKLNKIMIKIRLMYLNKYLTLNLYKLKQKVRKKIKRKLEIK